MLDDEKILLARLHREQELVISLHKVPLRPAAIALMDSNTLWGKWDPSTRTIYLSRRLIREHSWFDIRSILRHELAHQYCSEVLGSQAHLHDEAFGEACRKLGVPDTFSRASASLQENGLDWKARPQDDGTDKILARVQKLLALATSSNEHEALLAMEKVRELYARHNLDELLKHRAAGGRPGMVHLLIRLGNRRVPAHLSRIAGILAGYFFVEVLHNSNQPDPVTGETYQAIELIGTRENVLMAEYVYHFLARQLESLVKERKKAYGPMGRFEAKSYRLGILAGFTAKLRQADEDKVESFRRDERTPRAEAGKALVLLKKDTALGDYVQALYPRLRSRRSGTISIDGDVYGAGWDAGRRITLHRGVSDRGGASGRLLPNALDR